MAKTTSSHGAPPLPSPWEHLPPDDYAAWLFEFRRLVWEPTTAAVGEGEREYRAPATSDRASPDERFVQLVWAEQHLRPGPHKTARGRTVEVLEPGRWNGAGGPDFLKAELKIDGHVVRGDVEIHVRASGWRAHGHDGDFEYNGVVLHAMLENDDAGTVDRLQNGDKIERLCLGPLLYPDLETLERTLHPDEHTPGDGDATALGTCHEAVRRLDQRVLERFLDLAARERLEGKVARLAAIAGDDLDQGVYLALMTYLGQGPTKPLFFLLARRAPLRDLRSLLAGVRGAERVIALEAILLHVAGLMPEASDPAPDDEADRYLARLRERWQSVRGYFEDRLMPPTRRWFSQVRPVNFATRLIAGMAHVVARTMERGGDFADALVAMYPPNATGAAMTRSARVKLVKSLAVALEVEAPDDFWSRRYSFAAKPTPSVMKLIGPSRAELMAFNALLPSTILVARRRKLPKLEELCHRLYEAWPAMQDNAITRAMAWRLFAGDPREKDVIRGEARRQALFQVFNDCCGGQMPTGGCGYFGAPRAPKETT